MDGLLNVIPIGFVRVNARGEIVYANEVASQILHLEQDRLNGVYFQSTHFGQIGLDGRPMDPADLPLARAMVNQEVVRDVVHGITDPNTRHVRWLSVSAAPEFEDGKLTGAVASFSEITERIKNDQIYKQIIENSTDMICLHKADGTYEYVNPAAQNLLGYSSEELIGISPYDLFHPQDAKRIAEMSHQYTRAGEVETGIRYRIRHKDGHHIWLQTTAFPIKDPAGNVTGIQTISRDVSQDVRREQEILRARLVAEKASEVKSEFIANMSHDIRTPIHGILGITEMLMESCSDPSNLEMLEMVDRSAHALLNIINDLLDASRLESGQIQLQYRWFQLEGLIDSLRAIYAPEAAQRGLHFSMSATGQTDGYLLGDEARILQIVSNVISNAIRFTSMGSVHVEFHCSKSGPDKRQITVMVEDTGPGIAIEDQRRIFDRFVYVDVAGQSGKGSGLGLSIAQLLLREMDGEIRVESEAGSGSQFRISLELEDCAHIETQNRDEESNFLDEISREHLRVLIAEDAPENRILLSRFLKNTNWDLTFAEDGMQALANATGFEFDVILLDISMPELDGLQVATELRKRHPAKGIGLPPLIALSAYGSDEDFERSREAGFSLHLTKPFSKNKLLRAVASVVKSDLHPSGITRP